MSVIVGVVAELHRYPVKSMAGERLDEVELRWSGFAGDRRYGFYYAANETRFPWLTARDLPALLRHRAAICDPSNPRESAVAISTPDGARIDIADPALADALSQAAGAQIRLIQIGRGTYDAMPVALTTAATLAAVDAAHGSPIDPERFRSNIIIESTARDIDWSGRIVEFGSGGPRLLLNQPIPRCAMITIDPATGARDATIMRTVAQKFDNAVGTYCVTAKPGVIRVGDPVRLVSA